MATSTQPLHCLSSLCSFCYCLQRCKQPWVPGKPYSTTAAHQHRPTWYVHPAAYQPLSCWWHRPGGYIQVGVRRTIHAAASHLSGLWRPGEQTA